jgi:hypothetical protein
MIVLGQTPNCLGIDTLSLTIAERWPNFVEASQSSFFQPIAAN